MLDIVGRLPEFDEEDTIYVSEPWTEDSDAMVATGPEGALVPAEAAKEGLTYFLEIHIAIEVIEAWVASLKERPSLSAICERLIYYATYDA
ncbi:MULTISPECIES: hypothetical protein [unclassified Mesorhizobium]|uniref:hypothetical protein n=1 Tax=unclassified Mesorhizobium TaxID=325217 RepID=UPI0003CF77F3|nr:hypothetical protein [Mesorhizobium sp. LSJC280B00]ESW89017.1 hypothetical protein X772_09160 [Mesorhizobium sp. LSJC280B00]